MTTDEHHAPGLRDAESFGALLRRYRVQRMQSQAELAGRAGMSEKTISALETGHRRFPHLATIGQLSDALALSEQERASLIAVSRRPDLAGEDRPEPNASLPIQPTPFHGRERLLASIREHLRAAEPRVVTLVGPGGVGKTRVAVEAAREASLQFSAGVFFVDVSSLHSEAEIWSELERCLGIRSQPGLAPGPRIMAHIADQSILLVLDNLEHVIDSAAAVVAGLRLRCEHLKILATSREPLRIRGEQVVAVPPLDLPDPETTDPAQLLENEAIAFFVRSIHEGTPAFQLTAENAPVVVEMCRRLDGLPLALELMATRLRWAAPDALMSHLPERPWPRSAGLRDLPSRHQTMTAAIRWSEDLLSNEERRVFWRLSVFVGGCTLDDAERVCGEPAMDFLSVVDSLHLKSLIRVGQNAHGETRITMLETLREYAAERLQVSGEAHRIKERHAEAFCRLAVGTVAKRFPPRHQELAADDGNLTGALEFFLTTGRMADYLAMCRALRRYWHDSGRHREARAWFERALSVPAISAAQRQATLADAAMFAYLAGDHQHARTLLRESALTSHSQRAVTGTPPGDIPAVELAVATWLRGAFACRDGDEPTGQHLIERGLRLAEAADDDWLATVAPPCRGSSRKSGPPTVQDDAVPATRGAP